MQWAVSQAVPFRRMHVLGNIVLHQNGGWASGGWMSDSSLTATWGRPAAAVDLTQQRVGQLDRGQLEHGLRRRQESRPPANGPRRPTPSRSHPHRPRKALPPGRCKGQLERPRPELARTDSHRHHLAQRLDARPHASPYRFYIAHPGADTAATLNAQLAKGKNLLFTPGIYELSEPIRITRPDTVVMGLGFATLRPTTAQPPSHRRRRRHRDRRPALRCRPRIRPCCSKSAPKGSSASHARNPISLHDVFFRVAAQGVGRATVNLSSTATTPSSITPGSGAPITAHVGWTENTSANGLVVNGDNVTIYGLFVEHHQQFQVFGTATRGAPTSINLKSLRSAGPGQLHQRRRHQWMGLLQGGRHCHHHEAWGLGVYSVFRHPNVVLTRAIEVPRAPGVRFHHMITIALDDKGEISNVIDDKGGPTSITPRTTPKVSEFP
jgi:hypothetical protein